MSAGQDYNRTIKAGGAERINGNGETFVFCKFADRDIKVDIGGRKAVMRTGSYQEFEPLVGHNSAVTLYNSDEENPAIVTLVMGTGTYDEKIIRGEITTVVGIKTGGGEYIADTRKKLPLDVISVPGTGITENYGEAIKAFFTSEDQWQFPVDGGNRVFSGNPSYFKSFDHNPAVHDGVIVLGGTTPGNLRYWAIEIDPFTQTLIRDLGEVGPSSTSPTGFTRFGNTLYRFNSNGTQGIYQKSLTGDTWELLYQTNDNNGKLTVDSDGNLYLARSNNSVQKISAAGELLATLSIPDAANAGFGWKTNSVLWLIEQDGNVYETDKQLSAVTSVGDMGPDNDHCTIVGAYFYAMEFGTGSSVVNARATETVVDLFAGKAFLACENAWLGPRPNEFNSMRTGASITIQNAESGNPTVSGEIIKLILEWYLGKRVDLDYMDYIHAIEIIGSSDINGISYPPIRIQSNGQTFLAAKIPDDFRVIFPIQATLTIDQRAEQ